MRKHLALVAVFAFISGVGCSTDDSAGGSASEAAAERLGAADTAKDVTIKLQSSRAGSGFDTEIDYDYADGPALEDFDGSLPWEMTFTPDPTRTKIFVSARGPKVGYEYDLACQILIGGREVATDSYTADNPDVDCVAYFNPPT